MPNTALLQSLINAATEVSIIATDAAGIITLFNSGAERILGYTAAEVVGKESPALFHDPAEVALRAGKLQELYGTPVSGFETFVHIPKLKGTEKRDWTYITKDGQRRRVKLVITVQKDESGAICGYLGIATESTGQDHVATQSSLRELQKSREEVESLAHIVHRTNACYILTDAQGHIEWVNEGFTRITGYTLQEVLGRWHGDILQGPLTDKSVIKRMSHHLQLGEGFRTELINYHKNGTSYWIDLEVQPLRDETGRINRFLAIAFDITEAKRQTARLQEATIKAQLASEAKFSFLAHMSHAIHTPLNAIISCAHLLNDTGTLNEEQQEYANTITTSGDTLLTVINNILDFSKIESGQLELESAPFLLHDLLNDCMSVLKGPAARKGLKLKLDVDGLLPQQVKGDSTRLRQILINLLNNALKFTQQGEIVLSARGVRGGQDLIRFAVTDTGIGIAPASLDQLFTPFTQAEVSTREFGGTGLGLVICKHLAELMQGTIGVESQLNHGSTFHITLPLKAYNLSSFTVAIPLSQLSINTAMAGRTLQVLLAEDNPANQRLDQRLLEKFNCHVTIANNGVEAISHHTRQAYDLILMDIQMPEMDGLQAIRRIRDGSIRTSVPIVALLTANALTESRDREAAAKAGVDDYLTKPIRPGCLERLLNYYRDKPSLR